MLSLPVGNNCVGCAKTLNYEGPNTHASQETLASGRLPFTIKKIYGFSRNFSSSMAYGYVVVGSLARGSGFLLNLKRLVLFHELIVYNINLYRISVFFYYFVFIFVFPW